MRLTTPCLKSTLKNTTSRASTRTSKTKIITKNENENVKYPWLHTLKATALQHLAQKTGIKSSGPKAVLIRRLEGELPRCEYLLPWVGGTGDGGGAAEGGSKGKGKGKGKGRENGKELRILSIDMGIRNLAFACLTIPQPCPTPTPTPTPHSSSGLGHHETGTGAGTGSESNSPITLQAWRRLSIPHIREELNLLSTTPKSAPKSSVQMMMAPEDETNSEAAAVATKEDFSPPIYAHHAYTLITTLLDLYRPTHILIERQRFRSGGGSAVQEWTIRVGVFEGMLYAVLESIGRLSSSLAFSGDGGKGGGGEVKVWGMEPGRVSRFWAEEDPHQQQYQDQNQDQGGDGDGEEEKGTGKGKGKKRKSVRDVKKMKIGLVVSWLGKNAEGSGMRRVVVGEEVEVRKWVDAFLEKYEGKRRKKGNGDEVDIGKLDDLADCLVQGVTWLEWQRMRQKVVLAEGQIE